MLLAGEGDDRRGEEDIHERDLEHVEPADAHELIEAEARERPAHPDEEHEQRGDFAEEAGDVCEAEQPVREMLQDFETTIAIAIRDAGHVPSAEEKHNE